MCNRTSKVLLKRGSANTEPVDMARSHLQSLGTTTGGETLHSLGGKYSTRACASPRQGRAGGGDGDGRGGRASWKTWQGTGGPRQIRRSKKSHCSLHVVKYKTLKNNTVCGTGPSQLQGCWRCSETQKGAGGGKRGAGILNPSAPLKISW